MGMLESFNRRFAHWEWSAGLLCTLVGVGLAIVALAVAIGIRGGGGGGGRRARQPGPRSGIRVRISKAFIAFMASGAESRDKR